MTGIVTCFMKCPICKTDEFVEHIDYLDHYLSNFNKTFIHIQEYRCTKCKGRFSVTIDYRKDKDEYKGNHVIA